MSGTLFKMWHLQYMKNLSTASYCVFSIRVGVCVGVFPAVPVCVCKFDRKPRRCGAMRNSTAFCRAEMYSDLSIPSLENPASTSGQNAHTHTEFIINILAPCVFKDKRWRQNGNTRQQEIPLLHIEKFFVCFFFLRIKQADDNKITNTCWLH